MGKKLETTYSVSIRSISEAEPAPYLPDTGIICRIEGTISPPGNGFWNLQLFKIMNFRGIVDHMNQAIRDIVKTQGQVVNDVNTMNGQWSHTGLPLAYCGVANTVVVVAIWKKYYPSAPVEYSDGREHTPACSADCSSTETGGTFHVGY